jgi:hypothetical protein
VLNVAAYLRCEHRKKIHAFGDLRRRRLESR